MADKYLHTDVLSGGLSYLKTATTRLMICKNPLTTDSYATLNDDSTGKLVAGKTLTGGELPTGPAVVGSAVEVTQPTVSITATGTSLLSDDLGVVLADPGNSKVLALTEAPDLAVSVGNVLEVQEFIIRFNQPSQV